MDTNYIGADVDCQMTNLCVERSGRIIREMCVPTSLAALRAVVESVPRPRKLTLEEGPMAHWLARGLRDLVDELVVCDPRRNKLISQDGDADDRIDARKLAELYRGGHLRSVYHGQDDQRVVLKQWIALYHDRVKDAVRQINKVRGRCREHGMRPPRGAVRNQRARAAWLEGLKDHPLAGQLRVLFLGFDAVAQQVGQARREVLRLARGEEIVRLWQELPGVGPIRAITLLAYLDTPWRFQSNPHKLWKYCGVGLQHSGSGKDREGRMKMGKLQLAWQVNRHLKSAVMGAAVSAIQQKDNVFAQQNERLVKQGVSPSNARHTVARKLLSVMWGMWKTGSAFDPALVSGRPTATATPKTTATTTTATTKGGIQGKRPRQQQRQRPKPPTPEPVGFSARRSSSGAIEPSLVEEFRSHE